jgi:hypothetical protein
MVRVIRLELDLYGDVTASFPKALSPSQEQIAKPVSKRRACFDPGYGALRVCRSFDRFQSTGCQCIHLMV